MFTHFLRVAVSPVTFFIDLFDLDDDVAGNAVGAIVFTIESAFVTFERERIASHISEVRQLWI